MTDTTQSANTEDAEQKLTYESSRAEENALRQQLRALSREIMPRSTAYSDTFQHCYMIEKKCKDHPRWQECMDLRRKLGVQMHISDQLKS